MADMVRMTHPNAGEAGPVTRHAFETVWAPKGWKIVDDDKKTRQARRSRTETTKEQ